MDAAEGFDLIQFIKVLEERSIRYLLIGRWAIILHGAPLMTADYDFWIDPASKAKLLRILDRMRFEVPAETDRKSPIISVYRSSEKIDLFFMRRVSNRENIILSFDECWRRADVKIDPQHHFSIRVPSLKDLIELKKIPRVSATNDAKDLKDLQFLQALLKQSRR